MKQKEEEIKRLQNIVSTINHLEDSLVEKIDDMKEDLNDKLDNSTFTTAHNSYIINHLENNENNTNFNIKFAKAKKRD